ncbi:MAG: alpha/beta fold hydrolase, partial [Paracoccaceae bacterium]
MTWAALFLLLLAAFLGLTWVLSERLRHPMGSAARASAPGKFAELSQGVTHYRWSGPLGGPVAVCVHGLTSASYVWDPVVRALNMMGFRVLRYDLYGRGFSDRPPGVQDRDFFLRQLRDLLEDQGIGQVDMMVGYSMGGSIATAFTAEDPGRVLRLVLLAPAGLGLTPG